MQQREAITNWCPVVEGVNRVFADAQLSKQLVDDGGKVIERVRELLAIRHAALSITRVIGRNESERAGQPRNEIAELAG